MCASPYPGRMVPSRTGKPEGHYMMNSTKNGVANARARVPARGLALLASAACLSAAVVFTGVLPPQSGAAMSGAAFAQNAARPAGFADLVEKVKPAVISVRVKHDGRAQMM